MGALFSDVLKRLRTYKCDAEDSEKKESGREEETVN
jgi:hypothetical protein